MAPEDTDIRRNHRGTGIRWSFVVAALIGVALIAFVAQNGHDVRFDWLWFAFDASLAVMLLITALLAVVATSLGGLVWRARRRRQLDRRESAHDIPHSGTLSRRG